MDSKAQELCTETRTQYEQLLARRDESHERQLNAMRESLRQAMDASISLSEHQRVLAAAATAHRHERDDLVAAHAADVRRIEQELIVAWQRRLESSQLKASRELHSVKSQLTALRLDAARVDMARVNLERQIESLRGEVAAATTAEGLAEARLAEACRHLASLRAQFRIAKAEQRDGRDKEQRWRDKVSACRLAMAEMKGRLETKVATLESKLVHLNKALEEAREAATALQVQADTD